MKNIKYLLIVLAGALVFHSCDDDDMTSGNPVMTPRTEFSSAMFGDSLEFTVNATDAQVPLSTLKAQIFYGEEKVSETVIRTKTNDDYTGKIFVPYYANVPNATATLKLILQNINFTITEKEYDLPLSRPDYAYLTLVTTETDEDGNNITYRMERLDLYQYAVTADFPQKVRGYIETPAPTAQANKVPFGLQSGEITAGTTDPITFSNSNAGNYTISFNSFTYEAAPFIKLLVDGKEMEMVDDNNYRIDMSLAKDQVIEITGIPGMEDWWIDPDFLEMQDDGKFKFIPMNGNYRITANFTHEYFIVETLDGSEPATLQADGSGAIWIIGDGIGKPSVSTNQVGWTTEKALCMAPLEKGIYQITVVAGKTINASSINFKFFHQKGWGGEFKNDAISTSGDLIYIGDDNNGRDAGNLGIVEGKTLDMLGVYTFTVDVTAGNANAVLTVKKVGEEEVEETEIKLDGTVMEMVDADNYRLDKEFTQGQEITVSGISDLSGWWIDADYFSANNGKLTFLPISGKYRITANLAYKFFKVEVMDGNEYATLQADGTGAIWVIGDDEIGKPSFANKIGWNPDNALCLAPVGNKKYQITMQAGVNLNPNSLNFKFFYQKGWGSEFKYEAISTTNDIVYIGDGVNGRDSGNLGVQEGKAFTEGQWYVFTVDLSGGNDNAILTIE